jgi:hypothetical protein
MKTSLTGNRVSNVAYSRDGETAIFSAYPMEWKEAFASTKVDFGMTGIDPSGQYSISGLRFHDSLRRRLHRRQASSTSTVTYPSAPTATPSSNTSVSNLNFSSTNRSIFSIDEFTIGCKNCTLVGVVDIIQGTFTINSSATNELEEAIHFIEDGFFNVTANGVSAHIELENYISLTASHPFAHDIGTLALPGFQVCDYCPVSLTMLLLSYLTCNINEDTNSE